MTIDRPLVEQVRGHLFVLMAGGAVVGLVFSPPVLSIGLIGIVVLGLLDPLRGINPRWVSKVGTALRSPVFRGLIGLYLLVLLGVWQTEDWGYYLERLRVKAPLIALPLAWPGLVPLGRREGGWLLGGVAAFIAAVLAVVLINYVMNFAEINDMIRRGQAMPVPRNHIRFSLLIALATLLSVPAYRLRAFGWGKAWWAIGGFLFLGQHLLAVRSGLAGAYAGAGTLVLCEAWERGKWSIAIAGSIGLALLPVLAYATVPSLRTKLQYTRYELFHRDKSQDPAEYSDEGRFTSIRIGLAVWREHPVLGVGPGNLRLAMDRRYAEVLPGTPGKRPHNQFVSALAGSGVVGLVWTLVCFGLLVSAGLRRVQNTVHDGLPPVGPEARSCAAYTQRYPEWPSLERSGQTPRNRYGRQAVYLAVLTVFFLSCLVENTLENSVGASMFCLFLLLLRACAASLITDRFKKRRSRR